jgi:hypothetical protein
MPKVDPAHALIGGLVGAVAVTLLNEGLRRVDPKAPRLEKLGMDAADKILDKAGQAPSSGENLYWGTMAGDIISNALYYAVAASGKGKGQRTTGMGLLAGLGAVGLPKPLGLISTPTNKTGRTKLMTTAYYLIGAWVAGAVAKSLSRA